MRSNSSSSNRQSGPTSVVEFLSSRKMYLWFEFYWLSNGTSKIPKMKLSKISIRKNVLLKQNSIISFCWYICILCKSLSKYVVKWVGCNRRCTFSISDSPLWCAWNILDRGQTYFCMATFLQKTQSMNDSQSVIYRMTQRKCSYIFHRKNVEIEALDF